MKIAYLLPAQGGGGGAHSIVLDVNAMRKININAREFIPAAYLSNYLGTYSHMPETSSLFRTYEDEQDLLSSLKSFDIVIATIYHSVELVQQLLRESPWIQPAYYIQDYEPWFFANGSDERRRAENSYTAIKNSILFAKTDWLCDIVSQKHNVKVNKIIAPCYDQSLFFPDFSKSKSSEIVRIAAMIRPRTPRRGAERTVRLLREIKENYQASVDIHIFGCSDDELERNGLDGRGFFINHGTLHQTEVAQILRDSDIFIDLSDWQALGLTGLEAMASGCALILPTHGGANEYATHRLNAYLIDTKDEHASYRALEELIKNQPMRSEFRRNGLLSAPPYSPYRSIISVVKLLQQNVKRNYGSRLGYNELSEKHIQANRFDLGSYDFLDFGASRGSSIEFAKSMLGGVSGLGIDLDNDKVEIMREMGYDCLQADVTKLELPKDCVRFVTMIHFIEHLQDLESVQKCIQQAIHAAKDFIVLIWPYFDADEYLRELGLKLYWSDWTGHNCKPKSEEIKEILDDFPIERYDLMVLDTIKNSSDSRIHPLSSPMDQHEYLPSVHPPKKQVRFSRPIFREFICYVNLGEIDNWEQILKARPGAIAFSKIGKALP